MQFCCNKCYLCDRFAFVKSSQQIIVQCLLVYLSVLPVLYYGHLTHGHGEEYELPTAENSINELAVHCGLCELYDVNEAITDETNRVVPRFIFPLILSDVKESQTERVIQALLLRGPPISLKAIDP